MEIKAYYIGDKENAPMQAITIYRVLSNVIVLVLKVTQQMIQTNIVNSVKLDVIYAHWVVSVIVALMIHLKSYRMANVFAK